MPFGKLIDSLSQTSVRGKWLLLAVLACLLIRGGYGLVSHDGDPAERGRQAAEADLRAGRLVLYPHWDVPSWTPTFNRLLKERYGAESRPISFGGRVEERTEHDAYNAVMIEEMRRRYGADVFDRLASEAEQIDTAASGNHPR